MDVDDVKQLIQDTMKDMLLGLVAQAVSSQKPSTSKDAALRDNPKTGESSYSRI